jgi:molybdopterin converting factor small subunit
LKEKAGGLADHEVDAATVSAALRELEAAQPALRGWVLDERGELRRHINVFVNGERAEPGSAVGAEDRIEVLPAISGGS